jgi:hypothetical protein
VPGQNLIAFLEQDPWRDLDAIGNRVPAESAQHIRDTVERGHDVRLRAAQRTQTQTTQFALQNTDIDSPHGQVVRQVARARPESRRHDTQARVQFVFNGHRVFAKPLDGQRHPPHEDVAR